MISKESFHNKSKLWNVEFYIRDSKKLYENLKNFPYIIQSFTFRVLIKQTVNKLTSYPCL